MLQNVGRSRISCIYFSEKITTTLQYPIVTDKDALLLLEISPGG